MTEVVSTPPDGYVKCGAIGMPEWYDFFLRNDERWPSRFEAFKLAKETAERRAGHPLAPFVNCGADAGCFILPEGRYERLLRKTHLWPRYCKWIQSRAFQLWEAGYDFM
jgi:hypothetical protein